MRATYLAFAALLGATLLLMSGYGTAQSVYGQMWGRLTNASGAPVSGATVTVISVQTGASAKTKSDASGNFSLSNLSPDLYQIEVQADGFRTARGTSAVSADSTTTVNSSLQAGDPKVMADKVISEGSILKLDRTDISTIFDSRSIAELPLLDRNSTLLELQVPGATRANLSIPPNQNPQNGVPVNINGQHFSGSAFQLDGTENRDPLEGIAIINPTLDSVEEMKVTTQGYNAEFGQATAGVVTIQTKTGSNSWHGDAFGYRRTGFGESTDPFAPAGVPPNKHNIFGGSFGGPIVQKKLFVFGDYQGTRSSEGANVLLSVPPDSVRTTCLGSAAANGVFCNLSDYSQFINVQLTDPNGNPFPNYQIPNQGTTAAPGTYVTDQAVAILALLPAANHTPTDTNCTPSAGQEAVCNNYLASGKEAFRADESDVRIDYNASSRFRLFARYSFGEFHDNGPPAFGATAGGPGADVSGFAGVARTTNQGISSGFTETLSPKVLTDFRFGYFKYRLDVNAQDSGQTPNLGIPGIFVGQAGVSNPYATGIPDFQIPGQQLGSAAGLFPGADYLRLGYSSATRGNFCNCPLREREQQFQFVNNWTHSTGRHVTKWGADLRYLENYRLESDRPPTGFYSFAPGATGLGLATFLVGFVTSFDRAVSTPAAANAGERQKRFGFYGQDTWRVNSRLTVNYGLRWEIYFPQTVSSTGGFLIPNLNNHDPSTTFFSEASRGSNSAGGVSGNLTNFAPRIGIAYLINSRSVIRAGYGRSFDAGYAGDIFGIAATQNPPVSVVQKVEAVGFNLTSGPPTFQSDPAQFPSSCAQFSLFCLGVANFNTPNLPAPAKIPSSGAVLYASPARVRVPTVDAWNLTFQHELNSHLYFEVGYVGNKGTKVFADSNNNGTFYNLNQPSLQGLIIPVPAGTTSEQTTFENKSCRFRANGVFPGAHCLLLQRFRSFYQTVPGSFLSDLFEVRYFGNNANDNYHSLQAKVQKSFTHGYSFLAHYVWAKGLDYDANYFAVDRRLGYGPASFDIRHQFVLTNIWDLPIGRGKALFGGIGTVADRVAGGWTLSAITIWRSGLPFTPSYLPTACGNDTDSGDPCRPNLVGPAHILGSREQYFSTTGGTPLAGSDCLPNAPLCGVAPDGQPIAGPAVGPWQRPGAGQIGNVGRNSFTGPGSFDSDIALAKLVRISEHTALRFRADAFNAFNKVNLGNPNACVDCKGGGSITSLAPGATQRTLQFSLQVDF